MPGGRGAESEETLLVTGASPFKSSYPMEPTSWEGEECSCCSGDSDSCQRRPEEEAVVEGGVGEGSSSPGEEDEPSRPMSSGKCAAYPMEVSPVGLSGRTGERWIVCVREGES